MFKHISIGLVALITLLMGCGKSGEIPTPSAFISKTEARIAIQNASPRNGQIISNQTAIIHWATRLASTGQVKFRKAGSNKWNTIKNGLNTMHSIMIEGFKPGDHVEYYIIIDLQDGPYKGEGRAFSVATGGLIFTQKEHTFDIERDYQQHCAIEIVNNDDKSHFVKATVFNPHKDLIAGFVGDGSIDKTIELVSGEKRKLEMVVHAQDAVEEEYPFIVNLETLGNKPTQDCAQVLVKVKQVNFNVQAELGEVNPVTLATVLKIRNLGDGLTDFTVQPSNALKGRIKLIPEVNHALMENGSNFKIEVLPMLEIGMRELSGELILSAAGKKQPLQIKFMVPEGKQIFCATTQSVYQSSATTHFCTNREQVKLDLDTSGNGPEEGHIRNTRDEYEEMDGETDKERDDYILEKGEIDYRQIGKNVIDIFSGGLHGDKIQDPTGYNLAGQIIFGAIIGWPADVRDVWFSGRKMIESGFAEYKLDFLLSLVGAIPFAGDTLKIVGKYSDWSKYTDDLADAARRGGRRAQPEIETGSRSYEGPSKAPEVADDTRIRGPDEAEEVLIEKPSSTGGVNNWDEFNSKYGDTFLNKESAETGWREYQRAYNSDAIMVIGRKPDINVAKTWSDHQIMDISDWSPEVNRMWIQGAIDRKAIIYLGSPITDENLFRIENGNKIATVFSDELEQLEKAGYRHIGDYMFPPQ